MKAFDKAHPGGPGRTAEMQSCPLCLDSSRVLTTAAYGEYASVYCPACQLQFTSPMRHPGWEFYRDYSHYEMRARESDPAAGDWMASRDWRFRTFFSLCSPSSHRRVLDIGCGEGKFLAVARRKGFDVYGIDLDPRAVELARTLRNLRNVRAGDWEELAQVHGWNNFDGITLFDVLEHLATPLRTLQTISGLLRPGGIICITVPRLDRYPRLFDPQADRPPHHLTLWTERALTILLGRAGFGEVRVVKRPVMVEDFLLHTMWRTQRVVRKFRLAENPAGHDAQPSGGQRGSHWKLLLRKAILESCRPADWLLAASRWGEGFTLFACGIKPAHQ